MNMKYLDTFGKRLSFILELKDLKNKDLADAINKAPNTVSNYTSDSRNPDLDTLTKIADFLNIKVDFLLMRTDDYTTYISKTINGDLIEIELDDEKLHLSEKEIQNIFNKLENVGFDLKKLIEN